MMHRMRTTITLDPDVEALVHKLMRERGIGFKQAVNAALRDALTTRGGREPARTKTTSLGAASFPVEQALRVAAAMEDEENLRELRAGR
jgi:hypothetical protein